MNKIQIGVDGISTTPLQLGFEGEQNHTQVVIYWTTLYSQYPEATASLVIRPPKGDPYPKTITQSGNKILWTVTAADAAIPGSGEYQLTFTNGDEIIKTYIGNYTLMSSIIGNGEAPTPVEDWLEEANEALAEFGEINNLSASAQTVAAGQPADASVSKVDGHLHLTFKIPRGASGNETIDDTAGYGDTDKVWSANKTLTELDKKAPVINTDASTPADVVTLTDGADSIPMSVTAQIDPVQNLNGYDYPWAGGCGKNLCKPISPGNYVPPSGYNGLIATANDDGSITITGKSTSTTNRTIGSNTTKVLLPAGTYIYSGATLDIYNTYKMYLQVYDADNSTSLGSQYDGELTFTLETATNVYARVLVNANAYDIQLPTAGVTFYPMIRLSTVADDTYEPYENVCPITGWSAVNITRTGKNLWSGFIAGKYWETDGTESSKSTSNYAGTNKIKINGNVNFKLFSDTLSNGNLLAFFFDKNGVFISGSYAISDSNTTTKGTNVPVTIPEGTEYVAFRIYRSSTNGGVAAYVSAQIMLSYQEETVYEAYNGTTYAISIPSTPGTVYGGTLTVNKDGTGSLVVDRTKTTYTGTESWSGSSADHYFYTTKPSGSYNTRDCISNMYKYIEDPTASISTAQTGRFKIATNINFKDTRFASSTEFKAWLADMNTAGTSLEVVCPIETPVTYPLTASQVNAIITSLYGVNNVWADSGKVSVNNYSADTKIYVNDGIITAQGLLELLVTSNRESSMTATKNYTSGDLLIVGNKLYKATSNIANGATLTVGSNVSETTVASELSTIAGSIATGVSF